MRRRSGLASVRKIADWSPLARPAGSGAVTVTITSIPAKLFAKNSAINVG